MGTINIATTKKRKKKKKKETKELQVVWTKDDDPENQTIQEQETEMDVTLSTAVSRREMLKEKIEPIFWSSVWILWAAAALAQWMGSITSWVFGLLLPQAFGYMLWKLISFVMLLMICYILRIVKHRIESVLQDTKLSGNGKMIANLAEGVQRIRNLMICEVSLVFAFAMSVVYEIYVIISIQTGNLVNNIYAESTLMSMVAYFPVWALIHVVLVVYGWITQESMRVHTQKKMMRRTIDKA